MENEDDEYEYLFDGIRQINKEMFEIEKLLLDEDFDYDKVEKDLETLTNKLSVLKSYHEVESALLELDEKL
jgi:hypothetical protein